MTYPVVQLLGLNVLNATVTDELNLCALLNTDGVSNILESMASQPEEVDIQEFGCSLIASIFTVDELNVSSENLFEIQRMTLLASEEHRNNSKLCGRVCSIVENLARNEATNRSKLERSGIDIILSIMTEHKEDQEIVERGFGDIVGAFFQCEMWRVDC